MPRFDRDWAGLTDAQRDLFRAAVVKFVADLRARSFRKGLRVKRVQGTAAIFEMTWAPDGRATFQFGDEVKKGEPHIIWRRIGTHPVLKPRLAPEQGELSRLRNERAG